jgi:hypothetical protein
VISEFLNDTDRAQRLLRQLAGRLNIDFVDTTEALRDRTNRYPVYFPREGHLNEHGTAIVGDAIYRSLFDQKVSEQQSFPMAGLGTIPVVRLTQTN